MRRWIVLALVVGSVIAPATPPAASGRGRPSSITIVGHGWGHGRGMGQYGARGMAMRGYRWKTIVHHYYSNVRISRMKPTDIRVLIDRRRAFVIGSRAPFRAVVGRQTIARFGEVQRFARIRQSGGAVIVDRGRSGSGPWRTVARTRSRSVSFIHGSSLLGVRRSSGFRWYRGVIRAVRDGSHLLVIDQLDLEKYLLAVVPREMPASWPMEALKAQAVAARTYALRVARVARSRNRRYDICATPACQVYGGYARWHHGRVQVLEHPRTSTAVRGTLRRVMLHGGAPILAEYSSSTGGWTTNGGFTYMRPVRDRYDHGPNRTWKVRVAAAAIEASWPSIGDLRSVRVLSRTASFARGGRVNSMRITGTRRSVTLSGDSFRLAMGLRSRWFSIAGARTGGRYRFTANMGYGARDPAVAELQRRLRSGGYFPRSHPITTYFGPVTRRSVIRYQRAHRIQQTGYVGPLTRRALNR